ncbi:MAG: methenyltetrahydromethanopterin cyclohydrolase, partial [Candidatus Hydrothermarchaeales archaeon]
HEMTDRREELKIKTLELENGAKVIDCGIKALGSFEAAELFVKACLGGLGGARFSFRDLETALLPYIQVWTDFPAVACLASQKAGWRIIGEDFSALGSGPARILARKPKKTLEEVGYEESSDSAVIALECNKYPKAKVAGEIADACGIDARELYVLVARTSSLVGSAQVSARAIETALFKMATLGLDFKGVESALSITPVAPAIGDDTKMMGTANDMIIYGSTVHLVYSGEGMDINKIPSNTSPAYGKPFLEIFEEAERDFYKINPEVFAPAEVYINDVRKKTIMSAGKVNSEMLIKSMGLRL